MDMQKDTEMKENQSHGELTQNRSLSDKKLELDGMALSAKHDNTVHAEPLISRNMEICIEGPVLSAKRVNTVGRVRNVPHDTLTELEPVTSNEMISSPNDAELLEDDISDNDKNNTFIDEENNTSDDNDIPVKFSAWKRFLNYLQRIKLIHFLISKFGKKKEEEIVEEEKEEEEEKSKEEKPKTKKKVKAKPQVEEQIPEETLEADEDIDNGIITPELLAVDYRYVMLLGEGANGRTWLAKDRKTGLDVAIKELKFVDDFKSFELFQREAEVLKAVNVSGVPKFIANITEGMTSYIVQEYIPYPSLEKLIDEGHLFGEEEIFTILDEVSKILFALQTRYVPAIIHRDIKPGNIMYCRARGNDSAKVWLIDFGAVDNAHKQSSGSTVAGTYGYMAPEQLQGEVSPRSDFYALGATALHLLTGVFPYEIPSELFQLQFHPVIQAKAPATTKPFIDLLDKMLASNPEERPHDITELRKAILYAREMSVKYRQIIHYVVIDHEPATRLGEWYRSTALGSWIHAKRLSTKQKWLDFKHNWQVKQLEKRERAAAESREKMELMRLEGLKESGVECVCKARRISVYGAHNILEGIFMYEGNWYPAYIQDYDTEIEVRRAAELPPKSRDVVNTFRVKFKPGESVLGSQVTLVRPQIVWLDDELRKFRIGK